MNRRHPNHPDRKHARRQGIAEWWLIVVLVLVLLPLLFGGF